MWALARSATGKGVWEMVLHGLPCILCTRWSPSIVGCKHLAPIFRFEEPLLPLLVFFVVVVEYLFTNNVELGVPCFATINEIQPFPAFSSYSGVRAPSHGDYSFGSLRGPASTSGG